MLYVRLGLAVLAAAVVAALLWTTSNRPAAVPSCIDDLTLVDALQNAGSVEFVFAVGSQSTLRLQIDNEEARIAGLSDALVSPGDGPAELDPGFVNRVFSLCQNEDGDFGLTESG